MSKKCNKCGEVKELGCFSKKRATPSGLRSECRACISLKGSAYRQAHRERINFRKRESAQRNKEVKAATNKAWYEANKERHRATSLAWRKANLDKVNEYAVERRAAKIKRTVAWANREKIVEFYVEAKRLQEETGIVMHVDHIIPLRGKLVSGLHVETNLQILPWHDNLSKSNNFKP